jgi:hypothetical protein
MDHVPMIALDGLDVAVLGTGVKDGVEVLVYDAYLVLEMLYEAGHVDMSIEDYLEQAGVNEQGITAPLFVFLDDNVRAELIEARTRGPVSVH